MKLRKLVILTMILTMGLIIGAYAADSSVTSTVNASVGSSFSIQFYNDANIKYGSTIPFTTVDASSTENLPDSRTQGDGKSDVGLLITDNRNVAWYLKMSINNSSPLAGKMKFYMTQPLNRNTSASAAGSLGQSVAWTNIATTSTTIYTAAGTDLLNTPYGILATLSFKIDGTGLTGGTKTGTITYTLTETA